MWRRVTAAAAQRARPCGVVHKQQGQNQWNQNSVLATGGDALAPLYGEYVPGAELAGELQNGLPPSGAAAELEATEEIEEVEGGEHEELEEEACHAHVLVNGVLSLTCVLPAKGVMRQSELVSSEELNVMGDRGGTTLDVFYECRAPAGAASGTERKRQWRFSLIVLLGGPHPGLVREVFLGTAGFGEGVPRGAHKGCFIHGPSIKGIALRVTDEAVPAKCSDVQERELLRDVVSILRDPRMNPFQGSLPIESLKTRAEESYLYRAVVGSKYSGDIGLFLRNFSEDVIVFRYGDRQRRRDRNRGAAGGPPAPHRVMPSQCRVALQPFTANQIWDFDDRTSRQNLDDEYEIRQFIKALVSGGDMCQSRVISELRRCPAFWRQLQLKVGFRPSVRLAFEKFLLRHSHVFVWNASPGVGTRVGLASNLRYPFHVRDEEAEVRHRQADRSEAVTEDGTSMMDLTTDNMFTEDAEADPAFSIPDSPMSRNSPFDPPVHAPRMYRHDPYDPDSSWCEAPLGLA
eukprot:Hpha_TRINITY_DN14471_c0_g1::TRINITY_DN14471_c0_g1_i1::g.158010::m.158010